MWAVSCVCKGRERSQGPGAAEISKLCLLLTGIKREQTGCLRIAIYSNTEASGATWCDLILLESCEEKNKLVWDIAKQGLQLPDGSSALRRWALCFKSARSGLPCGALPWQGLWSPCEGIHSFSFQYKLIFKCWFTSEPKDVKENTLQWTKKRAKPLKKQIY